MNDTAPSILSFSATFDEKDRTLVGRDGSFVDFTDARGMPKGQVPLDSFPRQGGKVIFEWQIEGEALVDLVIHSDGSRVRDIPPAPLGTKTFTDLTEDGEGSYEWNMSGGHASLYADLRLYNPAKPTELVCSRTILGFTNAPVGGIKFELSQDGYRATCHWKVNGVGVAPAYLSVTDPDGKPIGLLRTLRKRGDPRTEGDETVDLTDYSGKTVGFWAAVMGQPQPGVANAAPFNLDGEGPVINSYKKDLPLPDAGVPTASGIPIISTGSLPNIKLDLSEIVKRALPKTDPTDLLAFEYAIAKKWKPDNPYGGWAKYGSLEFSLVAVAVGKLKLNAGQKVPTDKSWWTGVRHDIATRIEVPLYELLADVGNMTAHSDLLLKFEAFSTKVKGERAYSAGKAPKSSSTTEVTVFPEKIWEGTVTSPKLKTLGMTPPKVTADGFAAKLGLTTSDEFKVKGIGFTVSCTADVFKIPVKTDLGEMSLAVSVAMKGELVGFDATSKASVGGFVTKFGPAGLIVVTTLALTYKFVELFFSIFKGADDFRFFDRHLEEAAKPYAEAFRAALNGNKPPEVSGDVATMSQQMGTAHGTTSRDRIRDEFAKDARFMASLGNQSLSDYWKTFKAPDADVQSITNAAVEQYRREFARQGIEQYIKENVKGQFFDSQDAAMYAEQLILHHFVGDEYFAPKADPGYWVLKEKGAQKIPPSIASWYLSLSVKKDTTSYGRFPIQGRDAY